MGRDDKHEEELPLTEPEIIDCLFLTGGDVRLEHGAVVTVAWVDCHQVGERRVSLRAAMSRENAEEYCRKLMSVLGISERGH